MKHRTHWMPLLVFTLFALGVGYVLLGAASGYQRLAEGGEEQYLRRTVLQYAATRVRQGETVTVEPFGEGDALRVGETLEGECYVTRVYVWEGWLRELYTAADANPQPEDGELLLPLTHWELEQEGNLLTITANGERLMLYIP